MPSLERLALTDVQICKHCQEVSEPSWSFRQLESLKDLSITWGNRLEALDLPASLEKITCGTAITCFQHDHVFDDAIYPSPRDTENRFALPNLQAASLEPMSCIPSFILGTFQKDGTSSLRELKIDLECESHLLLSLIQLEPLFFQKLSYLDLKNRDLDDETLPCLLDVCDSLTDLRLELAQITGRSLRYMHETYGAKLRYLSLVDCEMVGRDAIEWLRTTGTTVKTKYCLFQAPCAYTMRELY